MRRTWQHTKGHPSFCIPCICTKACTKHACQPMHSRCSMKGDVAPCHACLTSSGKQHRSHGNKQLMRGESRVRTSGVHSTRHSLPVLNCGSPSALPHRSKSPVRVSLRTFCHKTSVNTTCQCRGVDANRGDTEETHRQCSPHVSRLYDGLGLDRRTPSVAGGAAATHLDMLSRVTRLLWGFRV